MSKFDFQRSVFSEYGRSLGLLTTFPRYTQAGIKDAYSFGFAKSSKDKTNFPLSQLPSLLVACVGKSVLLSVSISHLFNFKD